MNILERNNMISQHMDIMAFGGSAVKDKVTQDPMIFWNSFIKYPVNYYVPDMAIQRLRDFNSSARLMNDPVKRFKLVNELLAPYGFKSLAAGTNRRTFYCEYDPQIILKLASDSVGLKNTLRDIKLQNIAKPYVPKICSCTTDGILAVIERVEPMKEHEYRHIWANEIFDVTMTFLQRGLVMEDIGTNFFKNLGVRIGFGPVFLDAPDMYFIDPRKMKCIKVNPVTKQICGGNIDYNYDKGMSEIICTKCGTRYSAKYLAASEELINRAEIITGRKFNMQTNLKVNVVNRKDGSVVNSYFTESDYQLPVTNSTGIVSQQQNTTFNPNVVQIQHTTPEQQSQQVKEEPMKFINIMGKAYPAYTIYKLSSKLNLTSISDKAIMEFFTKVVFNDEMKQKLLKDLKGPELEVVSSIVASVMQTLQNNTNPAIVNTNAVDQVITAEPEPKEPPKTSKVLITISDPVENTVKTPEPQPVVTPIAPPAPMEMTEFVGIPISTELKKEILKLLPPIKQLHEDRDIRFYLGRHDVGQFLLANIKNNNLLNELKNFGGFLSQKIQEDLVKADLKAKTEATYIKEQEPPAVQIPKAVSGRNKIAPYTEFTKNDKTLVMYPKEVISDIFWMLSRIEKKHNLDVANFLANRIGVDYISHDKFVPMKKLMQENDRPKTTIPATNIITTVNTTTDTSRQIMTSPIGAELDEKSRQSLEEFKATLPPGQPDIKSSKEEIVFQGVTKQVNPDGWKQRKNEKEIESEKPANTEVTSDQNKLPEERPVEGLFPVKPRLENELNTAYANINTGTAVMGYPGESKVDNIRIAKELPVLQEKCYVRFNNFTPSNDPSEDFAGKLKTAIREYMASDVQKVMQDDGKGFEIRVLPTHDERNRDCFKIDAINYGTQLFTTFIYPIGGENENKDSLAAGILYAQGKKAFDNFMKENPTLELPEEAIKRLDDIEKAKQIQEVSPDIINNEKELVNFFNDKVQSLNMENITNIELSKRVAIANLQAALVDATRGEVSQDTATKLAADFINKYCNFSFA